ncbi:hypothetical protein ACFWNN_07765 [Lentzea sp. NPDC058450]|uniref:hypothetical protein n=1 Tax=Lentzea sp. NPDC058450 TaxID=3346505 RepID=UPI00364EE0B2
MSKKTISGLVLVVAAFVAVWVAGLASADEPGNEGPQSNNSVLTDSTADHTGRPPGHTG